MPPDARNLFDIMSANMDNDTANRLIMETIIIEGGTGGAAYNPDETQS